MISEGTKVKQEYFQATDQFAFFNAGNTSLHIFKQKRLEIPIISKWKMHVLLQPKQQYLQSTFAS